MKLLALANKNRTVASGLETTNYNGIIEFINALKVHESRGKNLAHRVGDTRWYGSYDINEAYDIAMGLNNKVAEVKTGLNSLKTMQLEYTPQVNKYSGRVNVSSMLSGVENCRIRFREVEQPVKKITMYVQINALSDVSSTDFVNKAVAIANAVNNLEKAGTRVEVIGYNYSSRGNVRNHDLITIKIKRFEDTLSLGQLYGVFAPSTFRRLIFRHVELYYTTGTHVPEGYGTSRDWTSPKGSINIPRTVEYNTLERAVNYVNKIINQETL